MGLVLLCGRVTCKTLLFSHIADSPVPHWPPGPASLAQGTWIWPSCCCRLALRCHEYVDAHHPYTLHFHTHQPHLCRGSMLSCCFWLTLVYLWPLKINPQSCFYIAMVNFVLPSWFSNLTSSTAIADFRD